jgi:hypothetical protein
VSVFYKRLTLLALIKLKFEKMNKIDIPSKKRQLETGIDTMLQKVVLYIVCASCALCQVWFAIYDMTYYYWAALTFQLKTAIASFITFHFQKSRESLHIAALVIRNYLKSIPSHFWVHFKQCLFLHKQGFENNEELAGIHIYVYRHV